LSPQNRIIFGKYNQKQKTKKEKKEVILLFGFYSRMAEKKKKRKTFSISIDSKVS